MRASTTRTHTQYSHSQMIGVLTLWIDREGSLIGTCKMFQEHP